MLSGWVRHCLKMKKCPKVVSPKLMSLSPSSQPMSCQAPTLRQVKPWPSLPKVKLKPDLIALASRHILSMSPVLPLGDSEACRSQHTRFRQRHKTFFCPGLDHMAYRNRPVPTCQPDSCSKVPSHLKKEQSLLSTGNWTCFLFHVKTPPTGLPS